MNIIVGLGYFGSIIRSKFEENEVVTVDPLNPKADYKCVDDVPSSLLDCYWYVVTPASTHYDMIKKLKEMGVINIWVEKPLCPEYNKCEEIRNLFPNLYCDYTWLKHGAVIYLSGSHKKTIQHLTLKWLNTGAQAPTDVSIVTDLVIHPLSIVIHLLGQIRDVEFLFQNPKTVILTGSCFGGNTFSIEVSNDSTRKLRQICAYCEKYTHRWSSDHDPYTSDALQRNIESFQSGESNNELCRKVNSALSMIDKASRKS